MAPDFLRILQENGPTSRSRMHELMGVSKDTIYRIAKDLLYAGRIQTFGEGKAQRYFPTDASDSSTDASDSSELTHELSQKPPLIGGLATVRSSATVRRKWYEDKEDDPWE